MKVAAIGIGVGARMITAAVESSAVCLMTSNGRRRDDRGVERDAGALFGRTLA
jgi:hypothetical protein